jgi:hypothetical protein
MMRWVTYLLFCILFLGAEVRAAFPIAPVPEPAPKEHVGLKEIKKLIKKMPQDNVGSVATVDKNIPGLLSFVFAIGGILMMFIPPIVLLFPLLEIAAIVLGVIGMGRRPRGLAIAGNRCKCNTSFVIFIPCPRSFVQQYAKIAARKGCTMLLEHFCVSSYKLCMGESYRTGVLFFCKSLPVSFPTAPRSIRSSVAGFACVLESGLPPPPIMFDVALSVY